MKLCMGCMNQIEEHMDTCPYCGFNEKTNIQESYYLNPGTVIGGKYIVGKVMNYNGYTISYVGMDAELERKVVVKEYLPSDFATRSEGENDITIYAGDAVQQFEQGLTQFLNDANTMQQIGLLEGIAQVYDCIAENDTGYVVSEYVEGKTLKDVLQNSKKLNTNKAKKIIEKVLIGLGQLHAKGIIHCDISPETIVITDNGDVKLIDFGAAKYVTTANSKSLAIILKQGYAPEEQYRSKGVRGPWTDVYAVAAVMYRMITGIVPPESVERALEDNIKEPSKLGINISENMENAIMNALNVYKDNRSISAEIFLKELNSDKVQRIKVKKNKRMEGKIPVWCKILVAGLTVIIIAGGILIYKKGVSDNRQLSKEDQIIRMVDIKNKSYAQAKSLIDELQEKVTNIYGDGYDIKLQELEDAEWIYDKDASNDTIVSCNNKIQSGEEITQKEFNKNKKITIKYTYATNKKLKYSDLKGIEKVFDIAYKLGYTDEEKPLLLEGEKITDDSGKTDHDFICIIKKDGSSINKDTIDNDANKDEEIEKDEIAKIKYCAKEFIYLDEVKDLKGTKYTENRYVNKERYLNQLKDNNEREKSDERGSILGAGCIDTSYYSFEKGSAGLIFKQNIAKGQTYDQSTEFDYLAQAVGKGNEFSYDGLTVKDVKKQFDENIWGKKVTFDGDADSQSRVSAVKVTNANNEQITYFKPGEKLTVEMIIEKPTQKPEIEKPTQKPEIEKPTKEPKFSHYN